MDKIDVTQADIDAWETYGPKIFHCEMTGPEALARHRLSHTPQSVEPVAWMYYAEDGQEATAPLKNRLTPNTMNWTERPLYTHPPATDVAALVEAAKEVSDRAFMTYRRNGRDHYIEDDSGEGCMIVPHDAWNAIRQALAPFTKGQDDE